MGHRVEGTTELTEREEREQPSGQASAAEHRTAGHRVEGSTELTERKGQREQPEQRERAKSEQRKNIRQRTLRQ